MEAGEGWAGLAFWRSGRRGGCGGDFGNDLLFCEVWPLVGNLGNGLHESGVVGAEGPQGPEGPGRPIGIGRWAGFEIGARIVSFGRLYHTGFRRLVFGCNGLVIRWL
jgi:hypothetical protein